MADSKSDSFNVKDLEIETPKYPSAESPLLIDKFLIVGFTESFLNEKIIKPLVNEINSKKNYEDFYNLQDNKNRYLPTNLSTIKGDVDVTHFSIEHIIEYAFPIPPKIFYYIENNNKQIKEPDDINFVFENTFNEVVNIGYTYGFYQKQLIELKKGVNLIIFIPKFFIIVSQYYYFYAYNQICKYIKEQFLNPNNEIPLEIQIYNIVNFLPCPFNNKIELKIFTKNGICNFKSLEEYLKFANKEKNYTIFLDKLGAFKNSEINMGKIFEILTPELIIQILFIILNSGKIAFFHEDLEILFYVMFFFFQVTSPITPKEFIFCKSPNVYYYSDEFSMIDSPLVGFPCDFEKIKEFNPIKGDALNSQSFLIYEDSIKRDKYIEKLTLYEIINLKNGNIKFFSLVDDCDNEECEGDKDQDEGENQPNYDKDEQMRVDINNHLLSLIKNPDNYLNNELNEIIFELYNSLMSLSSIIKEKKYFSYFIENDDIKKYSLQIQEVFLKFLVLFSNKYLKVKKILDEIKNERKNETPGGPDDNISNEAKRLSEIEQKIFSKFGLSLYGNNLEDFNKHKINIQSATRKSFDYLLLTCRINNMNKKLLNGRFIEFLDSIFMDKKKEEKEIITFFEFFKYYNEKMKKKIFNWANDDDIFDKKKIVKENETFYYYRYKTINLSNDLIFKYQLYLSELDENIKNKIFPKRVVMNDSLNSKIINNLIDEFLISQGIFNFQNLLQFCVLSVVVISIPELKLVSFSLPIYSLFSKMNMKIIKYVELILNISYRYFLNKEDAGSKEELNQYFNIYKKVIEDNNLGEIEELTLLKNKIEELLKQKKEGNLASKEIIKKFVETPEESLFKLTPEKLEINDYEDISKEGKINKKISITGDLLNGKEISQDFIYYPNTLFRKFDEMVYSFYKDMDIEKIRDDYYKLIINTMFYIRLTKEKFPTDILKFLFYCLIKEK